MLIQILCLILRAVPAAGKALIRRFRRWRTQRLLAALDKHRLRDIGLSQQDVANWRGRLRAALDDDADATRDAGEKCRRALTQLNDDQLSNLSEAGVRAWRAARRSK
jgi:uncharacterized protein YjiS (DUF1127 family)